MAEATVFQVEDGTLVFELVDKLAVGYVDTWQAPAGGTVATVTIADYNANATTWSCQVTSGQLSANANSNDRDVPATFCGPSRTIPQPGETSYDLDADFLQDVNVSTGLSRFLFENDTDEAYFFLGLDGPNPPRAIGRVRLIAGSFGGEARANLSTTVSLPCSRKPSIEFGNATTSVIV